MAAAFGVAATARINELANQACDDVFIASRRCASRPGTLAMFGTADLRALSLWCSQHRMSWIPGCSDEGEGGLLLRASAARHAPAELLLLIGNPELRLIDCSGETMASASTLPALLDALNAGVAERSAQVTG